MAGMPFTHLLAKVIAHLVYYAIFSLNAFPAKLGISDRLFSQEIAPQQSLDFKKDCCTRCGSYVETSHDHDVTNDMLEQSHNCVCLDPKNNLNGSINFCDLDTGMVVTHRVIKGMPIPDSVIKNVNEWGLKSKIAQQERKLELLNSKQK